LVDITARKVVGLKFVSIERNTGLHRGDTAIDDHAHGNAAQTHADEAREGNRRIGNFSPQPNAEEIEKDNEEDKAKDNGHAGHDVDKE
jgi:hypothetical protein